MTLYPVSGGKFINVAAIKRVPGSATVYDGAWIEHTNAETVVKLFENWEPKALAVTKVRLFYITSPLREPRRPTSQAVSEPFLWAIHIVTRLPTYVKGRAALVGDAVR